MSKRGLLISFCTLIVCFSDLFALEVKSLPRVIQGDPDISYYLQSPKQPKGKKVPMLVVCLDPFHGSDFESLDQGFGKHFRFFGNDSCLPVFLLGVDVWGACKGDLHKNSRKWHCRNQMFGDYIAVIENLKQNQPDGWSGEIVFFGEGEGGAIATALAEKYSSEKLLKSYVSTQGSDIAKQYGGDCEFLVDASRVLGLINIGGAGFCSWKEQLWNYIELNRPADAFKNCPVIFDKFVARFTGGAYYPRYPESKLELSEVLRCIEKNAHLEKTLAEQSFSYNVDALNFGYNDINKAEFPVFLSTYELATLFDKVITIKLQEKVCYSSFLPGEPKKSWSNRAYYDSFYWLQKLLNRAELWN